MAEIKLNKRYKYAGDIMPKLLDIGFDLETASDFLNDIPDADVAPRAEVANEIIFDLACKLHTMLPHKIHPIPIDGKIECNTYELGQEHVIFNTLRYLGELEKKYTEGEK